MPPLSQELKNRYPGEVHGGNGRQFQARKRFRKNMPLVLNTYNLQGTRQFPQTRQFCEWLLRQKLCLERRRQSPDLGEEGHPHLETFPDTWASTCQVISLAGLYSERR